VQCYREEVMKVVRMLPQVALEIDLLLKMIGLMNVG
jgi:hypothetical protein